MKLEINWRQKSIEALEKRNFGSPSEAPTNMTKRCLELCKLPIENFTVEDLRLMIGQQFSLQYLLPLAIEHLHKDIFIEGDLFYGDLLKNVLTIEVNFWKENKQLWCEIDDLIKNRRDEIEANRISTITFYNVC